MTDGMQHEQLRPIAEPRLAPLRVARAMLLRELRLAWRRPADAINPLFFLTVVVALFPLAISPLPEVLETIGPGVVWVGALLAALLPLNGLFGQDFDDGTLEHYLVAGQSIIAIAAAKTVALWLVAGLPIVLVSALLAEAYALPTRALPVVMLALALGSFSLSALGAVAAALTVGVQRATALIALLVLPLMVPVVVFGTRAIVLAAAGEPAAGPLYLLGAVTVLMALVGPVATALALRIGLE